MTKPFLELNGPANIVMLVQAMRRREIAVDLDMIEGEARLTLEYMKARETDQPKWWSEVRDEHRPKKGVAV